VGKGDPNLLVLVRVFFWKPLAEGTAVLLVPWVEVIKTTKLLRNLNRFPHASLQVVIISDLFISRNGEVLSQGVALESKICHYTSEIGVISEKYAKEVVDLALEIVGNGVDARNGFNVVHFVASKMDLKVVPIEPTGADVDHFKALFRSNPIDCCDVMNTHEAAVRVHL